MKTTKRPLLRGLSLEGSSRKMRGTRGLIFSTLLGRPLETWWPVNRTRS